MSCGRSPGLVSLIITASSARVLTVELYARRLLAPRTLHSTSLLVLFRTLPSLSELIARHNSPVAVAGEALSCSIIVVVQA